MTDAKAELVRSWLTKAWRDLTSARVLAASEPALLDTALYHCQQGAKRSKATWFFATRNLSVFMTLRF